MLTVNLAVLLRRVLFFRLLLAGTLGLSSQLALAQQSPTSDDFNGSSLNTSLWTVSTPAGGNVSISNGHALLAVPGGSNHDAFVGGDNSVRILQTISNNDFDVAVKFDSAPNSQYQGQGILVQQDNGTYLRTEIASNGSQTVVSASFITGGNQNTFFSNAVSGLNQPVWLQVNRSGNSFTVSYSTDGNNYSNAGTFTQSITVSAIGPYAWNYNSNPGSSPAITASVDYFHNLSTPPPPTAATPSFNPASGTSFTSTLSVTLSDSTSNSTIYYTTDGSTPTTSSTIYTSPISLNASTTINAIATAPGYQQSSVGSAAYTLSSSQAGAPVSDDFNGSSLNTALWTASAPAGGSVTVSNGHAVLTVPGGSNHDAFVGGNNSVRILQSISNSDFDVAAKFDSAANGQYQGEGILIQQDNGTYLRLEFESTGGQTFLFASIVSGGNQNTFFSKAVSGVSQPVWLQVNRSGSSFALSYSTNGSSYTNGGSFNQNLTVNAIGPYAWNYNSNPSSSPAITAQVDYFYNLNGGNGTGPPVISNVNSSTTSSGATITWNTDQASTSVVNYGTTTGYGSTQSSSTLTTNHSISLTGLTCQATYDYDVSSTSSSNQTATSGNFTFTTGTCSTGGGGGPVSDNFDESTLNTGLWTFLNPLGDGVVTMNGTGVTLNIPEGQVHDPSSSGNNAIRLMQSISNVDFEVLARFQSAVEIAYQDQGIMVQQDNSHFVRFDTWSDGTNVHLYAAVIQGGNEQVFVNSILSTPSPAAPFWFKLRRTGNSWLGSWSTDGNNFTAGASFNATLNVTAVGPFAGTNTPGGTSPAYTAVVDYFFNTANPIANLDGPPPFGLITVDNNPGSALVEKALADVQGTGQLNPIAGFEYPSGGIYWYGPVNSGNLNGPWNRYTIAGSGNAYEDMIPLDVNGDGAMDIVASFDAGGGNNYSIVWFENPRGHGGNPQTDTWVQHVIGTGYGEDTILSADIDGDGKIDIISSAFVYFQNSATSWTQVQYNTSFRGVALLDIGSGKGNINLVGTAQSSPYNAVWFENPRETGGNARTGTWIQHVIGPTYPCSSCSDHATAVFNTADFNGDGRMDVVMAQSEGSPNTPPPPGGLVWFQAPSDRRNGTWTSRTIDFDFVDAHAVRIGDMDNNGTPDLVTSEQDQSPFRRVSIFFNDGAGNFTQQILSNVEGHNTVIGDVRNTGFLDILNSGHGYYGDYHPLQIFTNPRAQ